VGARPSAGLARALTIALAVAAMLLAAACGGDGVLLDTGTGVPEGPTLTSLQSSIFTPRCAIDGCHAGSEPQQGMDLSAGKSYAHLVRVASTELPTYQRVAPKVSADSYIVMKLSGDPRIAGERMPFGGPYLTLAEIDAIRQWIDAGAPND
jgi:hypothetical protein